MSEGKLSEFQEIISRLEALKLVAAGDKAPVIPLIDPTANVLSLVAAAIARQDDLRVAEFKRIDDLREKSETCAHEVSKVQLQAQKDLAVAESKRIDALTVAESRRIDAILAGAANAVLLDRAKSEAQAAQLAAQVVTSAQTLQAQVATTAKATDARITLLEQSQYGILGASTQRSEGRRESQWVIGLVIGICLGAAEIIAHLWK
jgi:hypothetical protein